MYVCMYVGMYVCMHVQSVFFCCKLCFARAPVIYLVLLCLYPLISKISYDIIIRSLHLLLSLPLYYDHNELHISFFQQNTFLTA